MVVASHTVCVPKILEMLGPRPWDGYVAVPIETRSYPRIWRSHSPVYFVATPWKHEAWVAAGNKLLPYVCYHTKFRRSRSNHVGERMQWSQNGDAAPLGMATWLTPRNMIIIIATYSPSVRVDHCAAS